MGTCMCALRTITIKDEALALVDELKLISVLRLLACTCVLGWRGRVAGLGTGKRQTRMGGAGFCMRMGSAPPSCNTSQANAHVNAGEEEQGRTWAVGVDEGREREPVETAGGRASGGQFDGPLLCNQASTSLETLCGSCHCHNKTSASPARVGHLVTSISKTTPFRKPERVPMAAAMPRFCARATVNSAGEDTIFFSANRPHAVYWGGERGKDWVAMMRWSHPNGANGSPRLRGGEAAAARAVEHVASRRRVDDRPA
eukprot:361927-Chlamydomonas_euryale.AAC.6